MTMEPTDDRCAEIARLRGELQATREKLAATTRTAQIATDLHRIAATRFASLFASLPVACFGVDREGTVREWNRAAETSLGLRVDAIFDRFLWDVLPTADDQSSIEPLVREVLAGKPVLGVELQFRMGTEPRRALASAVPICDADGSVMAAIASVYVLPMDPCGA